MFHSPLKFLMFMLSDFSGINRYICFKPINLPLYLVKVQWRSHLNPPEMEQIVSTGIVDSYFNKLKENLSVDVAIVGGGSSGLVASNFLAQKGLKVALYERKLAPGGGMWGGALMFNEIVVQNDALFILDEFNITYKHYEKDYYTLDSVHATSALIYHATKLGVKIFNCTSIEDLVFQDNKVCGIVLNWTPVHRQHMHVDPLVIMAKAVIDGTGHDCDIARTLERSLK